MLEIAAHLSVMECSNMLYHTMCVVDSNPTHATRNMAYTIVSIVLCIWMDAYGGDLEHNYD